MRTGAPSPPCRICHSRACFATARQWRGGGDSVPPSSATGSGGAQSSRRPTYAPQRAAASGGRIATPLFAFGKNADVGHSLQVLVDEGDLELVRAFGRFAMTRRGNVRLLRRGRRPGGPLVRYASVSAGDRKGRPYRETSVHIVGAGALDGPLVGHGRSSAERSGDRSLRRWGRADKPSVTAALRLPCHSQDPLLGRQGKLASQ